MNLHSTTLYLKSQCNTDQHRYCSAIYLFCIDVPLDPEMIIAVQLSRSCTSVRVFAVFALFAFSRFAARFRGFRVFAFCCPFSRFRAKMPRITGAETHTFPAQGFRGCQTLWHQNLQIRYELMIENLDI